jgi:dienelactone hydrolase
VEAIAGALAAANRSRADARHNLLRLEAGHGFMCEERDAYRPAAAAAGWQALLDLFEGEL